MAVLIFLECLDLRKNAYSQTVSEKIVNVRIGRTIPQACSTVDLQQSVYSNGLSCKSYCRAPRQSFIFMHYSFLVVTMTLEEYKQNT